MATLHFALSSNKPGLFAIEYLEDGELKFVKRSPKRKSARGFPTAKWARDFAHELFPDAQEVLNSGELHKLAGRYETADWLRYHID